MAMSVVTTTTCVVVLLVVAVTRGWAQADSTVTFEDKTPLVVSGCAVGQAIYDRNLAQSTALGSKIALSLFRPWGDQLYFFGQLTTSLQAADSGPPETAIEIDNLIVNWTPAHLSALSLSFGRFDAPVGFERDDEPLNLIPTSSFTFELARPVKFTGVMARYAVNPVINLVGVVANGWNREADNNSGKTAGLRIETFPAQGLSVAAGAFYGPEQDSTNGSQRTLLTDDVTWQPLSRLIVQAEGHYGMQRNAGTNLTWSGVVGQVFWRLGRQTGVTVRGDLLHDPNGLTSGVPQTLSSWTISPWYFYREAQEGVFSSVEGTTFRLPAFSIRPALRFDHSTQPFFRTRTGLLRQSNVTALVELVYLF
jgi:hypothetical protein